MFAKGKQPSLLSPNSQRAARKAARTITKNTATPVKGPKTTKTKQKLDRTTHTHTEKDKGNKKDKTNTNNEESMQAHTEQAKTTVNKPATAEIVNKQPTMQQAFKSSSPPAKAVTHTQQTTPSNPQQHTNSTPTTQQQQSKTMSMDENSSSLLADAESEQVSDNDVDMSCDDGPNKPATAATAATISNTAAKPNKRTTVSKNKQHTMLQAFKTTGPGAVTQITQHDKTTRHQDDIDKDILSVLDEEDAYVTTNMNDIDDDTEGSMQANNEQTVKQSSTTSNIAEKPDKPAIAVKQTTTNNNNEQIKPATAVQHTKAMLTTTQTSSTSKQQTMQQAFKNSILPAKAATQAQQIIHSNPLQHTNKTSTTQPKQSETAMSDDDVDKDLFAVLDDVNAYVPASVNMDDDDDYVPCSYTPQADTEQQPSSVSHTSLTMGPKAPTSSLQKSTTTTTQTVLTSTTPATVITQTITPTNTVATLTSTSSPTTTTTTTVTTAISVPDTSPPTVHVTPTQKKTPKKKKMTVQEQEEQQIAAALAASLQEQQTDTEQHAQLEEEMQHLLNEDIRLLQVEATGNCFYHCINAATLTDISEFTYDDHITLRRQLASYIHTHPIPSLRQLLPQQQLLSDIMLQTGKDITPGMLSPAAYIETTQTHDITWTDETFAELMVIYTNTVVLTYNAYASTTVITLMSHMTGRHIHIYNIRGQVESTFTAPSPTNNTPIRILFRHSNINIRDVSGANHYELITSPATALEFTPILAQEAKNAAPVNRKQLTHLKYTLEQQRIIQQGGVVVNVTATLSTPPTTTASTTIPTIVESTTATKNTVTMAPTTHNKQQTLDVNAIATLPHATATTSTPIPTTVAPTHNKQVQQTQTGSTTATLTQATTPINTATSATAIPTIVEPTPMEGLEEGEIASATLPTTHSLATAIPTQTQPTALVPTTPQTTVQVTTAPPNTTSSVRGSAVSEKVMKPDQQPPHMPTHARVWYGQDGLTIETRVRLTAGSSWMSVDDRQSLVSSLLPSIPTPITGLSYSNSRVHPLTPPTPHTHAILLVFDTPSHAQSALALIPSQLTPIYLEKEVIGLVRGLPKHTDAAQLQQALTPWTNAAPSLLITRQGTKGKKGQIDDDSFFAVKHSEWEALQKIQTATLTTSHHVTWHEYTARPVCHHCWQLGHITTACDQPMRKNIGQQYDPSRPYRSACHVCAGWDHIPGHCPGTRNTNTHIPCRACLGSLPPAQHVIRSCPLVQTTYTGVEAGTTATTAPTTKPTTQQPSVPCNTTSQTRSTPKSTAYPKHPRQGSPHRQATPSTSHASSSHISHGIHTHNTTQGLPQHTHPHTTQTYNACLASFLDAEHPASTQFELALNYVKKRGTKRKYGAYATVKHLLTTQGQLYETGGGAHTGAVGDGEEKEEMGDGKGDRDTGGKHEETLAVSHPASNPRSVFDFPSPSQYVRVPPSPLSSTAANTDTDTDSLASSPIHRARRVRLIGPSQPWIQPQPSLAFADIHGSDVESDTDTDTSTTTISVPTTTTTDTATLRVPTSKPYEESSPPSPDESGSSSSSGSAHSYDSNCNTCVAKKQEEKKQTATTTTPATAVHIPATRTTTTPATAVHLPTGATATTFITPDGTTGTVIDLSDDEDADDGETKYDQ